MPKIDATTCAANDPRLCTVIDLFLVEKIFDVHKGEFGTGREITGTLCLGKMLT